MINSLLDSDLYKFTMQQAVLQHYPAAHVSYKFTNRGGNAISRRCFEAIEAAVALLAQVALMDEEKVWLATACPFFTQEYLDYLSAFRFKPQQQIALTFVSHGQVEAGVEWGCLEVMISGGWSDTILYEVPLMAIISETYFAVDELDWDYTGQLTLARSKGHSLFEAGCIVSEFGTRRRRSFKSQDIVIRGLLDAGKETKGKGKLAGTSNVFFARKYDIAPIGTIAHEWIMGIAAMEGYEHCNIRAMKLWDASFPSGVLSIALTDTFTTEPFFDDFVANPAVSKNWKGLRQDSGDPFKFLAIAKEAFERVGADPKTKVVVFSDGLNLERCLALKVASDEAGVGCGFGIGTFLTNDYRKTSHPTQQVTPGDGAVDTESEPSQPLNMVIKLHQINGSFCVKISDELTKNTGNPEAVKLAKAHFGLS